MYQVVLHAYMYESTLTHSHYKTRAYLKIGNVILLMIMLYLSLNTCTGHMAGMLSFSLCKNFASSGFDSIQFIKN